LFKDLSIIRLIKTTTFRKWIPFTSWRKQDMIGNVLTFSGTEVKPLSDHGHPHSSGITTLGIGIYIHFYPIFLTGYNVVATSRRMLCLPCSSFFVAKYKPWRLGAGWGSECRFGYVSPSTWKQRLMKQTYLLYSCRRNVKQHSTTELLGFRTLSIIRYSTKKKKVPETGSISILRFGGRHLFSWVLWKELSSITLSKGPNWVGVSLHTWGRKEIQFPKRCIF
jgi:hypothetical protein